MPSVRTATIQKQKEIVLNIVNPKKAYIRN